MRPKQWTKNLFVFAGIIFSFKFTEPLLIFKTLAAALVFCGVSGAVYIINDIYDYEKDRRHPEKCKRPIASGRLSIPRAKGAFVFVLLCSMIAALVLGTGFFIACAFYFFMNLAYSMRLKNYVIFDVLIISIGFVLRAMAGALVIDVQISAWLLVCTLFLALFLALCKRRNELVLMEERAVKHRLVLAEYTPMLVDAMIMVATTATVMSYSIYTVSPTGAYHLGTRYMYLTIPLVIFGIFRYLYLVHSKGLGGAPEQVLLKDKPIIADIMMWITLTVILLITGRA